VFLLVNESTVRKYQTALAEEIEPSINELIERAEQGLKALEKKESVLETKV
jgi:DASH complex subunit SPC19